MEQARTRNLNDRELRSLDLQAFLDLIQTDIKELDELRRQRRREERGTPASKSKASRKAAADAEAELAAAEEEPIPAFTLHIVECCGKRLGSFPAPARVRCPFCENWHEAGEFPAS